MSVIKRASISSSAGRPVAFDWRMLSAEPIGLTGEADANDFHREPIEEAVDPVEALTARLARLSEQLAAANAKLDQVRIDAHAKGFAEGLEAAEARDQERIDLLTEAARQASAQVALAVEEKGDLAIDIARATVSTILGKHEDYSALVTATARKWAGELKSSAVIGIRVSGHDFTDTAAAEQLRAATGAASVTIDPQLAAGACLFDLELGHVDASIPGQAAQADTFLRQHAAKAGDLA